MMFALWLVYGLGVVLCVTYLESEIEDLDDRAFWALVLAWPLVPMVYVVHWARAHWMRP